MRDSAPMSEPTVSPDARKVWAFLWARVKNLHPMRARRMVTTDQAPEDTPALWHVQDALDRAAREGQRAALVGVRDAFLSASKPGAQYTNVVTELDKLIAALGR